jgi:hypothetical protein
MYDVTGTLERFICSVSAAVGQIDMIDQPLWDTVRLPKYEATFNCDAFTVPCGNENKTTEDTNMYMPGQLPNSQAPIAGNRAGFEQINKRLK